MLRRPGGRGVILVPTATFAMPPRRNRLQTSGSEAFMTDISALDRRWQALIRSVSKNGDFYVAEAVVDELRKVLSAQEAVTLYVAIRDYTRRQEYEWRDEFIAAFPDSEPLLPAPLPRRKYNFP